MKFPCSMLRDYVETSLDAHQIGDLLTMAGFELEGAEPLGDDVVLDVKVMSNRGDGLSVFGLAREVLAKDRQSRPTPLYERASTRFSLPESAGTVADRTSVAIETPACRRYACRIFDEPPLEGTPALIRERLEASGMRSINLVVDLTNYVMLELGQPLHAFDMDTLGGGRIVVRQARDNERLTTLDGKVHALAPEMMMICDADRPVAVAGVMGGAETEVSASTKTVLLESASFVNLSVRKTRKRLGLNTEASYRFERSVDPDGVVAALNRFAELLAEVDGGASRVPGVLDVYPDPPKPVAIPLRHARTERLLGMAVTPVQMAHYLERLGCRVESPLDDADFSITPPSWRPDLVREDDLIEEIGRVHGFETIPETPIHGSATPGGVFGVYRFIDQVREAMLRLGYTQVISHTLRDEHPLDFGGLFKARVKNPVSPETAMLRNSLLPCLADAALRNGGRDLHLFEIGKVFTRGEFQFDESPELAILSTGRLDQVHWRDGASAEADFYELKGVVEQMGEIVRTELHVEPVVTPDPRFHPTRQAALLTTDDVLVGGFGVIHPDVAEAVGLPTNTLMAEMDLLAFYRGDHDHLHLRSISRNPAVRRDIAFQIAKDVPWSAVETTIREAAGEVLEKQWLFDVYEGAGLPEGTHSLAVAMQLRKPSNFTDEEANQVRDAVVAALAGLGAKPR
ncbi:MAG: phenylalanine--tRNA ligase subunit beta [Fimbriimonadaceae bacterium]|nr:phenylalanine--tRNA ligase subunit beta [Fimbriimonadaceae bacterium]